MEKKIILLLILVLIAVGVTGCVSPTGNTPGAMDDTRGTPKEKPVAGTVTEENSEQDVTSGVQNIPNIVEALSCMFDPAECQRKRELGETEENKQ
jgi:hypothetical protein